MAIRIGAEESPVTTSQGANEHGECGKDTVITRYNGGVSGETTGCRIGTACVDPGASGAAAVSDAGVLAIPTDPAQRLALALRLAEEAIAAYGGVQRLRQLLDARTAVSGRRTVSPPVVSRASRQRLRNP
ncbi:MAG: hypothetical protein U1F52_21585 [Burkholderiales bacterium]